MVCWTSVYLNLQSGLFTSDCSLIFRPMSVIYCLVCCPQSISIQCGLLTPVYQSTVSLPIDSLVCWPQSTSQQPVYQSTVWFVHHSLPVNSQSTNRQSGLLTPVYQSTASLPIDSLVCSPQSTSQQPVYQSTVWFVHPSLPVNSQSTNRQSGLFTPVYQSTASLPIDSLVCSPQSTNLQSGLLTSVCQSTAWIFDQSAVCFLNRIYQFTVYQFTVWFLISVYRSAVCFAYYYRIIAVCLWKHNNSMLFLSGIIRNKEICKCVSQTNMWSLFQKGPQREREREIARCRSPVSQLP